MTLESFQQALLDPSAPIPSDWPGGTLGVLLLFLVPVGGGIPAGVLMASNRGVAWPVMMGLYLVSDVILAFVFEPMLRGLIAVFRLFPPLHEFGRRVRTVGAVDEVLPATGVPGAAAGRDFTRFAGGVACVSVVPPCPAPSSTRRTTHGEMKAALPINIASPKVIIPRPKAIPKWSGKASAITMGRVSRGQTSAQ